MSSNTWISPQVSCELCSRLSMQQADTLRHQGTQQESLMWQQAPQEGKLRSSWGCGSAQLFRNNDVAKPIQCSIKLSRAEWLNARHKDLHLLKPGSPPAVSYWHLKGDDSALPSDSGSQCTLLTCQAGRPHPGGSQDVSWESRTNLRHSCGPYTPWNLLHRSAQPTG